MTAGPAGHEDWRSAADLLDVVAGRLGDALPVLARIAADVERDWPDDQGRFWGERVVLVRGVLLHELDAVRDAARLVGAALRDGLVAEPEDGGSPGVLSPPAAAVGRRAGGPRLGGTDGQRVDDQRGVRIAQLGDG